MTPTHAYRPRYAQYLPLACKQLLAGGIMGADAPGQVGGGRERKQDSGLQRESEREDGRGH